MSLTVGGLSGGTQQLADRVKAQEVIDDARDGNYPYFPSKQSTGLAADDPFANVDYAEWFKWKSFTARKHCCIQYARSKGRYKNKRKQDETAAIESSSDDSEDDQAYTRERAPAKQEEIEAPKSPRGERQVEGGEVYRAVGQRLEPHGNRQVPRP